MTYVYFYIYSLYPRLENQCVTNYFVAVARRSMSGSIASIWILAIRARDRGAKMVVRAMYESRQGLPRASRAPALWDLARRYARSPLRTRAIAGRVLTAGLARCGASTSTSARAPLDLLVSNNVVTVWYSFFLLFTEKPPLCRSIFSTHWWTTKGNCFALFNIQILFLKPR